MATTLDTLVQRTRRFLRDYPVAQDALSASITSLATTATVSTGSQFNSGGNQILEIDYESILLKSTSSNTLTFVRGYAGSTPATHAASAPVLLSPGYLSVEIIDALNSAKDEMYPLVYKLVQDTSLSGDGTTYEFTVPNMTGTYGGDTIPMQHLWKIELKESGDTSYHEIRYWEIRRGATPKIKFRYPPPAGILRVHGFGPFPDLSASSDTVDAFFPKNAERILPLGAASRLLASGEAGRARMDTGLRDDREAANRPGTSMNVSNSLYQRFQLQLRNVAMAPLPPHVVSVL